MFTNNNEITLEINIRKRIGKSPNTWKWNNILSTNP